MPFQFEPGRSITAVSLTRLLERLGADRDTAGREYERLRRSLIKFFDWRGAWPPDECADETLDRLARKLEDADIGNVVEYARGIARLVLLERRRAPAFSSLQPGDAPAVGTPPDEDDDAERLRGCFERCLDAFPHESRALIVGYYQGDRGDKIANRRRLARDLGLSDNALRSRIQRLRDRLELCVQECTSHRD